jgi:hypothetical protein
MTTTTRPQAIRTTDHHLFSLPEFIFAIFTLFTCSFLRNTLTTSLVAVPLPQGLDTTFIHIS